ncbi:maltose acetyltransferase domain-containing protein [Salinimonas chungwhensis]|uniref:maltose acetyltransferase domain-containing protein n=1 Tax=Salinimonas chungwhensis TaxID=265425 RepID=UPI0003817B2B|nr:maltose acetyltransferase domain-containing protein [Salinimonas chungwhensis]
MNDRLMSTPIGQQMQSGRWYQTSAKPLRQARQAVKALCYAISTQPDEQQRKQLIHQLLPHICSVELGTGFYCDYGCNIYAGHHLAVGDNVVMLDAASITLGNNVSIGEGTVIATVSHHHNAQQRSAGWQQATPVVIGHNVRLGAQVTVLPGAVLADNSVVPDYQLVPCISASHSS